LKVSHICVTSTYPKQLLCSYNCGSRTLIFSTALFIRLVSEPDCKNIDFDIELTWNVRTLNEERKFENLKKEMQKNAVCVLGVSEVRWKGEGEIRSGDYTVYYCGGDRTERGVAIVVHKSILKSVVKKSV
jgi:hypothetical protein